MGVVVQVLFCLSPGWWRVVVGPGVGLLNGGSEQDWPEDRIPVEARRPNGEFQVSGFAHGTPQVEIE